MSISPSSALSDALQAAIGLESRREHQAAASLLDDTLRREPDAPPALRFRALLMRIDLAVTLNELGEARGILAEAKQIPLKPDDRESLGTEMRRADDLEAFLTHRGCAG